MVATWAMRYSVGIRENWLDSECFGHGMSWEEAFAAAERIHQSSNNIDRD
jgi:hypothetical protein